MLEKKLHNEINIFIQNERERFKAINILLEINEEILSNMKKIKKNVTKIEKELEIDLGCNLSICLNQDNSLRSFIVKKDMKDKILRNILENIKNIYLEYKNDYIENIKKIEEIARKEEI